MLPVGGVPFGADTPALSSPGVWPLKSERLLHREIRENCPSAEVSNAQISETFVEEVPIRRLLFPGTSRLALVSLMNSAFARWQASMNLIRFDLSSIKVQIMIVRCCRWPN